MASTKKQLKLANFLNHRMRIDLRDSRSITGQMLGFDKHMNLVIADAEEVRRLKRKNKQSGQIVLAEEKRNLGLIILRGQEVVAAVMESPPPADPAARLGAEKANAAAALAAAAATGVARPAGRGASVLQGPAAGVGGPGFGGFPPQGGFPPPFGGPPGFGRGGPPPFGGAPQGFAPGPPGGFQPPFPPNGRGQFPPPPGYGGR